MISSMDEKTMSLKSNTNTEPSVGSETKSFRLLVKLKVYCLVKNIEYKQEALQQLQKRSNLTENSQQSSPGTPF